MHIDEAHRRARLGKRAHKIRETAGRGRRKTAFEKPTARYNLTHSVACKLARGHEAFGEDLPAVLARLGATRFDRLMAVKDSAGFLARRVNDPDNAGEQVWVAELDEPALLRLIRDLPEADRVQRTRGKRFRKSKKAGLFANLKSTLRALEEDWRRAAALINDRVKEQDIADLRRLAKHLAKIQARVSKAAIGQKRKRRKPRTL